ncbi:MAG: co-chaperone GroES [Candidatus Zixiibacteriota bacterium]|nr:co-chaperone GroES [candidate division Zixibacteria bacterium]TFH65050.1 MAG: co-chaperone GroES [candidate division Zixibacteria bacterium]
MNIQPLQDRVLVKTLDTGEMKKGGIIIPDTAKEKPQEAEVIAIGPGRVSDDGKLIPVNVKVGDKILFGKYSGTEVTVDGAEYLFMRESDILAVLKK